MVARLAAGPILKSDTLDPGIEGAILALWLSGLRNFRR